MPLSLFENLHRQTIETCVDIVASVPDPCRSYGDALGDLHPSRLRLLGCEAESAVVFEEGAGSRSTICSFGISVFVDDDLVKELKTRPFWFAPELARRPGRGNYPPLSDQQLRETKAVATHRSQWPAQLVTNPFAATDLNFLPLAYGCLHGNGLLPP